MGWSLGGMLLLEALSGLTGPCPGGLVLVGVAPVFIPATGLPLGTAPGGGAGHAPGPHEKYEKYEKPTTGAG